MKQLSFFGLGDGKFGGGSDNPNDEESYHDNYASGTPIVYLISSGRHSLYVVGQYDRKVAGTWRVGVEMPDKGEFPPWRIWYERQHEYSPIIVLEVPKDAKVVDVTTKFSAK